jgi:Zn-dependent protease/predicted transcriptional regulator
MKSYQIGSLFGIPIKLDLTFLIVLPLFAYLIGSQITATADMLNQLWGTNIATASLTVGLTPWLLGIVAAVGLFAGVLLHELGHSLLALHYGVSIDSITLWLFGGISRFQEMPERWQNELVVAVAGPVVSVVLGGVCFGLFQVVPQSFESARFVLGYLAVLNVALAAFNMLPGFPMDGGRVLRAFLARTRSYARATQIAASVGKVVALLLGLVGLLGFNLILIGIAFFIYIGASSEATQTVLKSAIGNWTVRDIMTPVSEINTVSPDMTVDDLLEQMLSQQHVGYPVMDDDELVGIVTLEDASTVSSEERDQTTVSDVMTTELSTVSPGTSAGDVFSKLQRGDIGRLAVTDDQGDLVGILTRTDLMKTLQILTEAGAVEGTEARQLEPSH